MINYDFRLVLFVKVLPVPRDEPLSQPPADLSTDAPEPQLLVSADSAAPAARASAVTHGER